MQQKIAILGSTGSIGRQALDIIRRDPERYRAVALSAHTDGNRLAEQAREFRPAYVALTGANPGAYAFGGAKALTGPDALAELVEASGADAVLYATTGFAGLRAVEAGIKAGKRVLLANKEALVCAGDVFMPMARKLGVTVFPVDSEHSAVFQCLMGQPKGALKSIVLTCSGGAFRDKTREELACATAAQALAHPNWKMGEKITVDCATLVNKGLEVIEAHHLFGASYENIECVLHRESIVHSMVRFTDGSTLAQMSYPTMEIPIALSFSYPARIPGSVSDLDLTQLGRLTFAPIDTARFPAFTVVTEAGRAGGLRPAAVSAADEVSVRAYLAGKLTFYELADCLAYAAERAGGAADSLEAVEAADGAARRYAEEWIALRAKRRGDISPPPCIE